MRPRKVTATYSGGIILTGLSVNEIQQVKRELTFANPSYKTAKRYSRYAYVSVPPYLEYYDQVGSMLQVPVGYDASQFDCDVVDERVLPVVNNFPEFVLELRDSQKQAAESYIASNKTPVLNGSIQLPTGKGKSILGLYLASYYKTRTLIVVHKDDLVNGWMKDIDFAFNHKIVPGLIKAKSRKVGHFITIATIQTLNRLSAEELDSLYSQFGLVIQDEMHHCPASSFSVVSNFKSRYKLGLTATPERSDGLDHVMNLYYGGFCYRYEGVSGEDDEDILPVKVITRKLSFSLDPLCEKSGSSYRLKDLNYPVNKEVPDGCSRISEIPHSLRPRISFQAIDDAVVRNIMESVCEDILSEYDKGRSCVVFFTQKEHCRLYYDYLSGSVSTDHLGLYYGDNPNNQEVLEKAEKIRKFITLTTYAKATEGTNVKQWEVEFLVSSINNGKNVEQAAGRIRRVKESGKINPALLYDYRTPRVYSLGSHATTRNQRYRDLKFSFAPQIADKLFSRGYRK